MSLTGKVSASGYLVLVPDISASGDYVWGIRIDRYRAEKPSLKKGEIAIGVRLTFDKQQLVDSIPFVETDVKNWTVGKTAPEFALVGDSDSGM